MEEIEALIKAEKALKKNDVFEITDREETKPKEKQKRHYSDSQKEALRERLTLAREKAKQIREMKSTIKEVIKDENHEEFKEKTKKYAEQSINERIAMIMKKKEEKKVYNRPTQEIKQNKPVKAEPVKAEPVKAEPVKQEVKQSVPVVPVVPVAPQKVIPKYYLPKKSYFNKHGLF